MSLLWYLECLLSKQRPWLWSAVSYHFLIYFLYKEISLSNVLLVPSTERRKWIWIGICSLTGHLGTTSHPASWSSCSSLVTVPLVMRAQCPLLLPGFRISLFRVYWQKQYILLLMARISSFLPKVFEDVNVGSAFITLENFPVKPVTHHKGLGYPFTLIANTGLSLWPFSWSCGIQEHIYL